MQAMEIDDAGIEMKVEDPKKIKRSDAKQVSWHEDVNDIEKKDPTPIGSVPKPPSLNTQTAYRDRKTVDTKTIRMSKEEQTLDKCCPSCWKNGMKETCICGCPAGFLEEAIRFFCCDCFFDWFLFEKKKNEIPEGKQEENDSDE